MKNPWEFRKKIAISRKIHESPIHLEVKTNPRFIGERLFSSWVTANLGWVKPEFERLRSIFWTTPDHFPVKDMCIHVYIYVGKFDHDLTVLPNPGIMVNERNHPQMAARFRLVKYYNLPRYSIYIYIYTHICVCVYGDDVNLFLIGVGIPRLQPCSNCSEDTGWG